MNWLHLVSYFFGGMFAANAVPHYVAGVSGRPMQSPFAKPPGKGLSSSRVNVLWGLFKLALAYLLVVRVGTFQLHAVSHVIAFGFGVLLLSFQMAHHFGQFYGGNAPSQV